ncbi:MAG: pyroglutamyl-peptidase I [Bacillus sp. (in: Bacteria)]|nr:pyroglutamyl-peptidase I [Bacillus sp. (in: firmicutes)]
MKLLLSGFEPFGGLAKNPTMDIISASQKWQIPNMEIYTVILPVVYEECATKLIKVMEDVKPDYVISLGVAVGRSAITPERIGINIQDTAGEGKTGDNRGIMPKDQPIDENGPAGLFSTLPIREMKEKLGEMGIPADISNTAGTYICNNTMYSTLLHIERNQLPVKAGFIHVPATPEMTVAKPQIPSMALETQEAAIKAIVEGITHGW